MRIFDRSSALLNLIFFIIPFVSCSANSDEPSKPDPQPSDHSDITLWLTNPDKSALFQKQNITLNFGSSTNQNPIISVDDSQTFQTMDGFGYSLTGGSAMHIYRMEKSTRAALLDELFKSDGNNIGVSYLRISIGASDLDDRTFSYNDLPAGETDPELKKFSLAPDKTYLIPLLKEILAINPDIKILGSPWSPPAWMKTNNSPKGGSLKPEWYGTYANYFVKYIEGMKAEGIRVDAITVQNEPLHPGNNPSLLMVADAQAEFVKNHLGPAFKGAGIDTKIIIYDHNADRPDYPISILNDPEAKKYIDGSAFHLYGGKIEALSDVHSAHPDKSLYFTEQWIGAPGNFPDNLQWHTRELIIGATRNWCKTVLEWNLAADSKWEPHTDGGCTECLGALTITGNTVVRNPAYYIIAHASKFVRPGSVRIGSTLNVNLPNVAFKTPAGNKVLIVLNNSNDDQRFNIRFAGKSVGTLLKAGAVGTYIW
ncbi:glycoside hydrolase family 30 protein [Arcticibacter tournemirensis]|uniref:Glucosylceramidase n=1 Tax=Arcticibacter tournemirensis TaxID=699437 RepID=A0A4Q0MDG7_9SPHI|nr:glycoside hydrolase family 30 beta sandwich domain-containing protein [Arcticibacter tournemirensis]RXF71294.1 glucosylceramidase [Arcticibacter tournemirensis]